MTNAPLRRCANCERAQTDVALTRTKVHGELPLCPDCRTYADTRGWLKADQPLTATHLTTQKPR